MKREKQNDLGGRGRVIFIYTRPGQEPEPNKDEEPETEPKGKMDSVLAKEDPTKTRIEGFFYGIEEGCLLVKVSKKNDRKKSFISNGTKAKFALNRIEFVDFYGQPEVGAIIIQAIRGAQKASVV